MSYEILFERHKYSQIGENTDLAFTFVMFVAHVSRRLRDMFLYISHPSANKIFKRRQTRIFSIKHMEGYFFEKKKKNK